MLRIKENGIFIPKNDDIIVGIDNIIVIPAKNFIILFILLDWQQGKTCDSVERHALCFLFTLAAGKDRHFLENKKNKNITNKKA